MLNTKSLKEQVYEYLKEQIHMQQIKPGEKIDMNIISTKLGISKTPLRDALIQLEVENFVSIYPRRGIYVNAVTIDEIKNNYQIIGALEATALRSSMQRITPEDIENMKRTNQTIIELFDRGQYELYYEKNLKFHDIYIKPCGNPRLVSIVDNLKKRLYDFAHQKKWSQAWTERTSKEHQDLVSAIEKRDIEAAVHIIKNIHWSFETQEKYVEMYYFNPNK